MVVQEVCYPLFVYGTLRQPGSHHYLLAGSECLYEHYVLNGFALYNYQQQYPFMLRQADSSVIGEVYRVDEPTLGQLHEWEEVAERVYRFVFLPEVQMYTYVKYDHDPGTMPLVESGDWIAYVSAVG